MTHILHVYTRLQEARDRTVVYLGPSTPLNDCFFPLLKHELERTNTNFLRSVEIRKRTDGLFDILFRVY